MVVRELSVPGALEMTPVQHGDDRGVFLEWFREDRFAEATGHAIRLSQANCSVSGAGTLRGIHFAEVPPSQAKCVTCVSRRRPRRGRRPARRLADLRPVGLGAARRRRPSGDLPVRGPRARVPGADEATTIAYLCSAPYAPGREHGVHPLDPDLASTGPPGPPRTRPGSPSSPRRTLPPRRWPRSAPRACWRPTTTASPSAEVSRTLNGSRDPWARARAWPRSCR